MAKRADAENKLIIYVWVAVLVMIVAVLSGCCPVQIGLVCIHNPAMSRVKSVDEVEVETDVKTDIDKSRDKAISVATPVEVGL